MARHLPPLRERPKRLPMMPRLVTGSVDVQALLRALPTVGKPRPLLITLLPLRLLLLLPSPPLLQLLNKLVLLLHTIVLKCRSLFPSKAATSPCPPPSLSLPLSILVKPLHLRPTTRTALRQVMVETCTLPGNQVNLAIPLLAVLIMLLGTIMPQLKQAQWEAQPGGHHLASSNNNSSSITTDGNIRRRRWCEEVDGSLLVSFLYGMMNDGEKRDVMMRAVIEPFLDVPSVIACCDGMMMARSRRWIKLGSRRQIQEHDSAEYTYMSWDFRPPARLFQ